MAEVDRVFGRQSGIRVFDPDLPPATAWERRRAALSHRLVVASFRMPPDEVLAGRYDRETRRYFSQVPDDVTFYWSYYHEVEPLIDRKAFTAEDFRLAFRHLVGVAQGLCRPNLFPTLILTGYTAGPSSGRDWRTYYPGEDAVSVLAWDPYNSASARPTVYEDPATLFAPVVQASRQAGKPWAIAETGSQLIPGDATGAGRAAWLTAVGDFARSTEAVFVLYYNSIGRSGADYRLLDTASVRAWTSLVGGQ